MVYVIDNPLGSQIDLSKMYFIYWISYLVYVYNRICIFFSKLTSIIISAGP
ncbi:hypothetical protein HanRHA438_Chr02g0061081 [Helianthus annuus]|nr:hypothetical protein HanRHA438_Chr02g0061081 [Helianthus annuus]